VVAVSFLPVVMGRGRLIRRSDSSVTPAESLGEQPEAPHSRRVRRTEDWLRL